LLEKLSHKKIAKQSNKQTITETKRATAKRTKYINKLTLKPGLLPNFYYNHPLTLMGKEF